MLTVVKKFFPLPLMEKAQHYSDDATKSMRLSTNFNVSKKTVRNWRGYLRLHCYPLEDYVPSWPSNPTSFNYSREVRQFGFRLLRSISESLELGENCLLEALGEQEQHMAINYYHKCPEPELTLGLQAHTDPNALIILLQDPNAAGLQVLKDGQWIAVNSQPNALVVNMGDQLQMGKFEVVVIMSDDRSKEQDSPPPPKSLLVVSPTEAGTYPVLLFLHGFFLRNSFYGDILRHVASHGFIVVAPQLTNFISSPEEDIASAAAVTDWLAIGLQPLLPKAVVPNLGQLALAGHSRGGHTAFSLALGHAQTTLKFSLLMGIDPVAGTNRWSQVSPKILTHTPSSLDINLPVLVFGTGLGSQRKDLVLPPCAPPGVNHDQFYFECKPTCYHFVAKEYGHLDMLDDGVAQLQKAVCKCGCTKSMDDMRKTTGGLMAAFLKENFGGEKGVLGAIVDNPGLAPALLDPVAARRLESNASGRPGRSHPSFKRGIDYGV